MSIPRKSESSAGGNLPKPGTDPSAKPIHEPDSTDPDGQPAES